MKILITGSTGFLGKYIVDYFNQTDTHYLTIGRNKCDIYYDFVSPISTIPNVDCVIHIAGSAHKIFKTSEEQLKFNYFNCSSVQNLLESLKLSNVKPSRFVLISSVSVYGLLSGNLINESAQLNAEDPYGKSKICAENALISWCSKNNIIFTILRLPLVVGYNAPGNLSDMIKAIQKKYYFNVSQGKAKKSMVLAEDVSKYILKASEIGGVFNLTDGHHPSFLEFSSFISAQLGKNKPRNIPFWFASFIAKFGDLLGENAPLNTKNTPIP